LGIDACDNHIGAWNDRTRRVAYGSRYTTEFGLGDHWIHDETAKKCHSADGETNSVAQHALSLNMIPPALWVAVNPFWDLI
jgi:hypothetical protein